MKIKKVIICKEVGEYTLNTSILKSYIPKAGDVAIFEVLEIGKHDSIQSTNGNNSYIFPGDLIMNAFGNRYATGQFEGYVPTKYLEKYQILGKGGAVGELISMNVKLLNVGPTELKLIGYAVDSNGNVINTKYLNQTPVTFEPLRQRSPKIYLSIGSSMDSGKTTTAAYLSRGLMLSTKKVAFIKLTGTVYTKDKAFVRDCGAEISVDFSNAGFPSTYMCSETELLNLYEFLLQTVSEIQQDYIIMEIADGLLQRETAMLLNNHDFMQTISGVVFSCGDSLSALSGVSILEKMNQKILCVGGLFTISPLLIKEVQDNCNYPVKTLSELSNPAIISILDPVYN